MFTSVAAYPPGRWLLLLLLFPTAGVVQAQEAGRFWQWLVEDTGAYGRDLGLHTPLPALTAVAMLVPAARYDPVLQTRLQAERHGPLGPFLNATNTLGGPRAARATVGVFAVTLLLPDAHLQDAAFTSMQAVAYAGVVTAVLKTVVGRRRPEHDGAAYRFRPFSGNTSFPSGHATAAFALVTPWVWYYPHPVTYGLFVLSTGTAVARIARDKHWPTDVVAGAAIGFFTGRYLARRHLDVPAAGMVEMAPTLVYGGVGVRVRWALP